MVGKKNGLKDSPIILFSHYFKNLLILCLQDHQAQSTFMDDDDAVGEFQSKIASSMTKSQIESHEAMPAGTLDTQIIENLAGDTGQTEYLNYVEMHKIWFLTRGN